MAASVARAPSARTGTRAVGPRAAVLLAAAVAWVGLLAAGDAGMGAGGLTDAVAFVAAWTLMMAAMMLPTVVPFVALVARGNPRPIEASALAAAGYLAIWTATGVAALAAERWLTGSSVTVAAVLATAGVYQLTPLKTWCLRRCRSPLGFLLEHWSDGRRRAPLRLGAAHGRHCVGCCWALMVVLIAAAGMGLVWVALTAAVVLVEKNAPRGERLTRPLAVLLILIGAVALVAPGLLGLDGGSAMAGM